MRRLLPPPSLEVEAHDLVTGETRTPPSGRPWVVLNMITSADGAVTGPDGRSGPLSGPADRSVFHALRGEADVVLAGANTVRIERYGLPHLPAGTRQRRHAAGRSPLPHLAVATASLQLDPGSRFFREAPADQPPVVLTSHDARVAHPEAAAALDPVATVVTAGRTFVEWPRALQALADLTGAGVVLVEGGPALNGQLLEADLVDELCLTISPLLAGGSGPKAITGPTAAAPAPLTLARMAEADGFLLLRYLRAENSPRSAS